VGRDSSEVERDFAADGGGFKTHLKGKWGGKVAW